MTTSSSNEAPGWDVSSFPGSMGLERWIFAQERVWVDVSGVRHRLEQMTTAHRANVIADLLRHADRHRESQSELRLVREFVAFCNGQTAPDSPVDFHDAVEWLEASALMQRLRQLTPQWHQHVTENSDRLVDHDTGRWLLTTQNAWYLLDLDERTSSRAPLHAGAVFQLRRDRRALPLLRVVHCRRGASGVLLVDIRNDGVPTLRATTPIRWITRTELRLQASEYD